MAQCIEKLACKDCGSSDSLQTYLNIDTALGIEWYTSFCHGQCWENKGDVYNGIAPKVHIKTEKEISEERDAVLNCPRFMPTKPYRDIPPNHFRSWGVRVLFSEFDGKTPYALAFPYTDFGKLKGWKSRPLRKKDMYAIGTTAGCDPFGFERAMRQTTGDILWITEGEFDAIALHYCLTLVIGEGPWPVISLSQGGGSVTKDFNKIGDRVATRFKEVRCVFDNDTVGINAGNTAQELWPEAIIIEKPNNCKDANDAVSNGLATQMAKLALEKQ